MEVIYSNSIPELFKDKFTLGIYGDKLDLINNNIEFNGIEYNDNWSVKRFLNGLKYKINSNILDLFDELNISVNLLNKKIKELSNSEFKFVLLCYVIINKKELVYLDYFDKGLSYKNKKKLVYFLKRKYDGNLVVISNDLIFLNNLCKHLIVFKESNIVFNDKIEYIYKSKVKIDYPEIIKFIRLANKNKTKLSYTVETRELLKDIYRSVR